MTLLFVQLVSSVTGHVITIVALELAAAIIGFIIAWFYAKSVHTPVIKDLEADRTNLNSQVVRLKGEIGSLSEKANNLDAKISKLEEELASKDKEIKDLSSGNIHVGKYVISATKGGGNHFNLIATNGQVILTSLMYDTIADCTNGIDAVRANCLDDSRFDRKISSNNKHYFNLTAPDGQILGKSEMYESVANMEKGIASVKRNGISTIVTE
jgi:uncharacterized protein